MSETVNNSMNDETLSKSRMPGSQNTNVNSSLKKIYKQLRPPLITQRVYDDLSACIVFQILLFLANEHVRNEFNVFFKTIKVSLVI
jgi:hypothetical protein